jgi:hypothetical protein
VWLIAEQAVCIIAFVTANSKFRISERSAEGAKSKGHDCVKISPSISALRAYAQGGGFWGIKF